MVGSPGCLGDGEGGSSDTTMPPTVRCLLVEPHAREFEKACRRSMQHRRIHHVRERVHATSATPTDTGAQIGNPICSEVESPATMAVPPEAKTSFGSHERLRGRPAGGFQPGGAKWRSQKTANDLE